MYKAIISLLAAMLPLCALAADKKPAHASVESGSSYSLFDNIVKFHAPADWPVILKKTEGLPQFIAFQVKDPADQGSGESSQVSVEAKLLNDSSIFQALVNAATDKTKKTPGYEQHEEGVDATTLRYFGLNGKTRYEYRETWYLDSKIFIHVRCSRPMLAATTPAWTAAYEQGCAQIMRTIRQH